MYAGYAWVGNSGIEMCHPCMNSAQLKAFKCKLSITWTWWFPSSDRLWAPWLHDIFADGKYTHAMALVVRGVHPRPTSFAHFWVPPRVFQFFLEMCLHIDHDDILVPCLWATWWKPTLSDINPMQLGVTECRHVFAWVHALLFTSACRHTGCILAFWGLRLQYLGTYQWPRFRGVKRYQTWSTPMPEWFFISARQKEVHDFTSFFTGAVPLMH
jgi:hypothetical protein